MCEEGDNCIRGGGIYQAEKEFVEVPDLRSVGKGPKCVCVLCVVCARHTLIE